MRFTRNGNGSDDRSEARKRLDERLRPRIDPEAEIVPDWKRTRDKIATPGNFERKRSASVTLPRNGRR